MKKIHKYNTDIFIKKSKEVHGDRYGYDKVEYINSKTKVEINCPIHGSFYQVPAGHISGKGCLKCSKNNPYTKETFVEKAKEVHGDKYDYSKIVFNGVTKSIDIICKKHGMFSQNAHKHLSGDGCPICGGHLRLNKDIFIDRSIKVHGNKYDYSQVNYINNRAKVKIICPSHGEFEQSPDKHMSGQGCSKCRISKGERSIEKILRENNIKFEFQKTFDDCKNKSLLPFDFYISELNICVEYDGEMHFNPSRRSNGVKKFKKTMINDNIKNKYCRDNGIELIRISYYEYNDIEDMLLKKLKKETQ